MLKTLEAGTQKINLQNAGVGRENFAETDNTIL